MESGNQVDVIYLDLQKAFDKVPHARLLSKVKSYGVKDKLLQWIGDFIRQKAKCAFEGMLVRLDRCN